jgi:hypothetical protein
MVFGPVRYLPTVGKPRDIVRDRRRTADAIAGGAADAAQPNLRGDCAGTPRRVDDPTQALDAATFKRSLAAWDSCCD